MEVKQEKRRRLTAKRKSEIVLDILQGKRTISEVSRANDITPATIEEWIEEARKGMENQLRAKPKDIKQQYEDEIKKMKEVIGDLTLQNIALLSSETVA
jgi:transposase-like protein